MQSSSGPCDQHSSAFEETIGQPNEFGGSIREIFDVPRAHGSALTEGGSARTDYAYVLVTIHGMRKGTCLVVQGEQLIT